MSEKASKRLFIALGLPGEIKSRFAAMKEEIPGLKWTSAQSLHITLRFLGEIPLQDIPGLKAALAEVKPAPFSLRIAGLRLFARGAGSIVWAGLTPCAELALLKESVDAAVLSGLGLAPDGGRFRPHITLGRMKSGDTAALRAFVNAKGGYGDGEFGVAAFTLFSSVLKPGGAEHFAEEVYPLQG